jgi:hypothetical protein
MKVNSYLELVPGDKYVITMGNKEDSIHHKIVFVGLVNEYPDNTDVFYYVPKYKGFHVASICEVGIGINLENAKENIYKFKKLEGDSIFKSLEECKSFHKIHKTLEEL